MANRPISRANLSSDVDLPPDPVIEAYKKDIDRTLLRENLKLTPEERLRKLQDFAEAMIKVRGAARRSK